MLQAEPVEGELAPAPMSAPQPSEELCPKCGSSDLGTYTLSVGSRKTVVGCRSCRRWHRTVAA